MFAKIAHTIASNGWPVIPTAENLKKPLGTAWERFGVTRATPAQIDTWARLYPNAGVGTPYGPASELISVDCDFLDYAIALEAEEIVLSIAGATPAVRVGQAPKTLFFYRKPEPFELASKNFVGFEIFSRTGSQTVLFGKRPDIAPGAEYRWRDGLSPLNLWPCDLPPMDQATAWRVVEALKPLAAQYAATRAANRPASAKSGAAPRPFYDPLQLGTDGACDRASGAMARVLPLLRASASPLQLAARLIEDSPPGDRHPVMTGVVCSLTIMGAGAAAIIDALLFPYLGKFDQLEAGDREASFRSAVAWAARRYADELALPTNWPGDEVEAHWRELLLQAGARA